ncbi:olfactory receptor 6F1-like [Bufo gargarizans]|uniref:olfactory receptor 6F1-like n=1 Tax=Bufo gargarizans TaxID=30331 RepID=UPI001CF59572|nr:olfactory receptor 6F1-like [Bufo gargarizans]
MNNIAKRVANNRSGCGIKCDILEKWSTTNQMTVQPLETGLPEATMGAEFKDGSLVLGLPLWGRALVASQEMDKRNQSTITEFLLLGFGSLHNLKILVFTFGLIVHIMALTANVLVIVLVVVTKSLHSPMYFFLSQLSLSEILFTSNIVPNMLWLILKGGGKVSVFGCLFQLYLLATPTVAQCLLLAAMAFDRHVAICRPLHYATIMTFTHQLQVVTSCWLVGFTLAFLIYISLSKLKFCGFNTINHFYCDIAPLLQLSCSSTSSVELVTALIAFTIVWSPFMFIIVTYISIIQTILNIPSSTGRHKAFSTCSSHLIIVCMYYGTLSSIYIFPPRDNSINLNKGLSVLYTLVTPLFNPLIYSLRNQNIRGAIFKYIQYLRLWKAKDT